MSYQNVEKYQKAVFDLLHRDRFYGELLLDCTVVLDAQMPKHVRAKASSRNGVPTLLFRSDFVSSITTNALRGVLKHELMHILLDHLKPHKFGNTTEIEGLVFEDDSLWNIAEDIMINQECDGLQELENKCTIDQLREISGQHVEAYQTSEYYFKILKSLADDKRKKAIDKMKNFDDHDYKDPEEDSEAQASSAFFNVVNKVVSRMAGAGNVPQHSLNMIGAYKSQLEQPWDSVLANFMARTSTSEKLSTRKRPNKRYNFDVPGYKRIKELTLALCIDESGSMGDEDIAKVAYQILELLSKAGTLHLIHADCQITNIETYKKGDEFSYKRTSGGGTAYDPALQKAKELEVDGIVYFGDMDTADVPEDPGIPVLWVTTSSNMNRPGGFGEIVRLN